MVPYLAGAQCQSLLLADLAFSSSCSQVSLGEWKSMLLRPNLTPISATVVTPELLILERLQCCVQTVCLCVLLPEGPILPPQYTDSWCLCCILLQQPGAPSPFPSVRMALPTRLPLMGHSEETAGKHSPWLCVSKKPTLLLISSRTPGACP